LAPEDPVIGILDPLVEGSTTELNFPDDEGTKLLLIFDLSICEIGPVIAGQIAVDYEFASVDEDAFGPKEADADATRARWVIAIDSALIEPGVHRGSVVIGGNESVVKRVTIPVILTKSESEMTALLIGGAAWLIGVLGAFFTAATVRNWRRFGTGGLVAIAPAVAILKAQYWDAVGWTGTDSKFLLFVGVLAASFGAAKAVMIDRSIDDDEPRPERRSGRGRKRVAGARVRGVTTTL
jgi:hypothetical protein